MSKNHIPVQSVLDKITIEKISFWAEKEPLVEDLVNFLSVEFHMDITSDIDIVKGYIRDSSNIEGHAEALCRPVNERECALVLKYCHSANIPITIVAGRSNLTGSATPKGGILLSIEKLKEPYITVDSNLSSVTTPVGVYLEEMRKEVLKQSNDTLQYPVDPTSRKEAMVGGTLSCNASGFVPGPAGATRYWVEGLEFLTPNGYKISCNREEYISENGKFHIEYPEGEVTINIPSYPRPKIKNASGPYSDESGIVDLVDLLVGSEGIFGLITSSTFNLKKLPDEFLDLFFTLPNEKDAVHFHQYISNHFNGDLSNISALEYFGYNCQSFMDYNETLFNSPSEVGIYLQIPLYNETVEDVAEFWLNNLLKSDCNIHEDGILLLNSPQNWETFFNARHSIPANALKKTRSLGTWSILTDTIVPPENFSKFLDSTHLILQNADIEYLLFGHLGDCHLHFHLIPTKDRQPTALDVYDQIIELTAKLGGVYSAEHGTGKRKRTDFMNCYGKKAVEQIQQIKSAIDPHFILNRGNVVEPLLKGKEF